MKRFGLFLVSIFFGLITVYAASVALVYENDASVLTNKSTLALPTADGYVIPASVALAAGPNLLIGEVGGKLHKGVLVRLDNDLNLAFVRLGQPITGAPLEKAFQDRSSAVAAFIPAAVGPTDQNFERAMTLGEPFLLKINGQDVGVSTVTLKTSLKKSKFKLELVSVSTSPVWNFAVELQATPKLSFWKEGRKMELNNVPEQRFVYRHQKMFAPMKTGDSYKIPIEVFFINEQNYDLAFRITTKTQLMEKVAHVQFK